MPSPLTVTANDFSTRVEHLVIETHCSYMEAVLDICDEYDIEPDAAKPLLTKPIVERLQTEAIRMNLLPKTGMLPV